MQTMRVRYVLIFLMVPGLNSACQQTIIDRANRSVYAAIEERQQDTLGTTTDVHILEEYSDLGRIDEMYKFVPRPLDSTLPEAFDTSSATTSEDATEEIGESSDDPADDPAVEEGRYSPDIFRPDQLDKVKVFGLREAMAYAVRHGRDLQNAKEDLYLAALDLTLERHLWTPQLSTTMRAEFADFGQVRNFDRAMTTVADAAVAQRLPYGGQVSARIVSDLMRDLGRHVTSGESGSMILDANIPLFRGAGRVAYESRYASERELIYAVRTYERFRRTFLVQVASDFFDLQQRKAAITNAYMSYVSFRAGYDEAEFKNRIGRAENISDLTRAASNLRSAETNIVSAKEIYGTALDRFKIVLGMPVDVMLDIVSQEEDEVSKAVESLLPNLSEESSVQVACKYRLDLLTIADRVDDTRRGVTIAKNRILPDLDFNGSVTMGTDPNQKNSLSYNTERTTWRGSVEFRMDDRKTERNAYRRSFVLLRRAERNYEQSVDTVRADVRRALRRIQQQDDLRQIQALNVQENMLRVAASKAQFELGRASNQDVIDAENELLDGRNGLARAVADYRVSILRFRLDTGTLRVTDDGRWQGPNALDAPPELGKPDHPGS